jgi:multiple sugar transport system substrate-binding protein
MEDKHMSYRRRQFISLIMLMSLLAMLLAACGGGGGGGQQGGTSPSPAGGDTAASPAAGGDTAASPAAGGDTAATPEAGGDTAATPAAGDDTAATPAAGDDAAATPEAGAGGAVAASECPADVQGGQVTMWSPLTGGDGDELTRIAEQFNQENENGIQVQHVPQPEYDQKLNTAAAGGNLPDMTVVRASDIPLFATRNLIQPMPDEVLNIIGGEGLAQDFPEDVWDIGEYNGQRYAIPLDVQGQVLYYNTEMVEAAGVEIPADRPMTREEFEAAVEALNQNGVMGIAIGTHYSGGTWFDMLIRQFGGNLWNEEGTAAGFNTEEGRQALEYLLNLKQTYSPNISGTGDPEVVAFQQGRAAMVIHGPWWISGLRELPFTGFAMVPQIGDEYAVIGGSHQLALTTDDPARQAAAACWIGWLSENSVQWAAAGNIPARTSERESAQIAEISPAVAAIAEEAEHLEFPPPVPGISEAVGLQGVEPALNQLLLGERTDIEAALEESEQRADQLIEQNAQQYGGQ